MCDGRVVQSRLNGRLTNQPWQKPEQVRQCIRPPRCRSNPGANWASIKQQNGTLSKKNRGRILTINNQNTEIKAVNSTSAKGRDKGA